MSTTKIGYAIERPASVSDEFMIDETSNTWLNSLKGGDPRADGWRELVDSYGPFVRGILVSRGISLEAAEDISQNVLTVVVRRLPEFERQRTGSFRSWLRTITTNCLREYQRSKRSATVQGDQFEQLIQSIGTLGRQRLTQRDRGDPHPLTDLVDRSTMSNGVNISVQIPCSSEFPLPRVERDAAQRSFPDRPQFFRGKPGISYVGPPPQVAEGPLTVVLVEQLHAVGLVVRRAAP